MPTMVKVNVIGRLGWPKDHTLSDYADTLYLSPSMLMAMSGHHHKGAVLYFPNGGELLIDETVEELLARLSADQDVAGPTGQDFAWVPELHKYSFANAEQVRLFVDAVQIAVEDRQSLPDGEDVKSTEEWTDAGRVIEVSKSLLPGEKDKKYVVRFEVDDSKIGVTSYITTSVPQDKLRKQHIFDVRIYVTDHGECRYSVQRLAGENTTPLEKDNLLRWQVVRMALEPLLG